MYKQKRTVAVDHVFESYPNYHNWKSITASSEKRLTNELYAPNICYFLSFKYLHNYLFHYLFFLHT